MWNNFNHLKRHLRFPDLFLSSNILVLKMTCYEFRRTPYPKVSVRKIVQLWFLGAACFMFYYSTRIQELKLNNNIELKVHHKEGEAELVTTGKSPQFPEAWEKGARDPFFNLTIAGDENSPGLVLQNTFRALDSRQMFPILWMYLCFQVLVFT